MKQVCTNLKFVLLFPSSKCILRVNTKFYSNTFPRKSSVVFNQFSTLYTPCTAPIKKGILYMPMIINIIFGFCGEFDIY